VRLLGAGVELVAVAEVLGEVLGQVFILSPSARTGPSRLGPAGEGRSDSGCSTFTRRAKPATRRVADGERMNPPGKGGAYAPIQETTSTRAMRT
jgi:hypothetical protein